MYKNLKFTNGGLFSTKDEWCHQHRKVQDSAEIIIVTEGKVKMFVENKKFAMNPGDVLQILPGHFHGGYEKTTGVSFFWLHFTASEYPQDMNEPFAPENIDRVMLLARELLHYQDSDGYEEDCTTLVLRLLMAEMRHRGADNGKLISEVKEWIRRNSYREISATCVAEQFGYNEDYLNRIFRKAVGKGIKSYIIEIRLNMIKRDLLVGNETLGTLWKKYGFSEYKYFLKFFKYHEGISPSNYRKTYYNMHTN